MPLSQYSSIIQQASRLLERLGALPAESQGLLLGASVTQCAMVRTIQGCFRRVVTRLVSARSSPPFMSSWLVSITCVQARTYKACAKHAQGASVQVLSDVLELSVCHPYTRMAQQETGSATAT